MSKKFWSIRYLYKRGYVTFGDKTFASCLTLKKFNPWYTCDLSLHQVSAMSMSYFERYEHFSVPHFHFLGSHFGTDRKSLTTIIFCQNKIWSKIFGDFWQRFWFPPSRGIGLSVLFGWGKGGVQIFSLRYANISNLRLRLRHGPFKKFLLLVFCQFYTSPVVV